MRSRRSIRLRPLFAAAAVGLLCGCVSLGPTLSTTEAIRCSVDATRPEGGVLSVTLELPSSTAGRELTFSYRGSADTFRSFRLIVDGVEREAEMTAASGDRVQVRVPAYRASAILRYDLDPLFFPPGTRSRNPQDARGRLDGSAGVVRTEMLLGRPSFRSPLELTFRLPDGWSAVAPWAKRGDAFLADAQWADSVEYVGMGPFAVREASVGACRLSVAVHPDCREVGPGTIEALLGSLLQRLGPPAAQASYSAICVPRAFVHGGAAGGRSILAVDNPVTITHELVHWWNDGERVAADAGWFHEGFTEYAGAAWARAAGGIDAEWERKYFADLNGEMRFLEKDGGISLRAASLRMGDRRMSRLVYSKGALLALRMERLLSASGQSVDELLAAALSGKDSGGPGGPLSSADLRALARDLYGGTVDELFDLHVFGSAPLPDLGLPAATWETGAAYFQGAAHD